MRIGNRVGERLNAKIAARALSLLHRTSVLERIRALVRGAVY